MRMGRPRMAMLAALSAAIAQLPSNSDTMTVAKISELQNRRQALFNMRNYGRSRSRRPRAIHSQFIGVCLFGLRAPSVGCGRKVAGAFQVQLDAIRKGQRTGIHMHAHARRRMLHLMEVESQS